ncbi:MAG: hypothetical protein RR444_04440 [Oscillospiraceae bacterium]
MSYDLYKKVGIEILASLQNKENAVVAISTSNESVDTYAVARELADAFVLMNLSATVVNAKVDGSDAILNSQPKKINDKLFEVLFEKTNGQKMTSLLAKRVLDEIKELADVTIIALDELTNSAPAMMLSSCCDGVVLAERKNVSRTDNIDKTVQIITNICVKPLGFILV